MRHGWRHLPVLALVCNIVPPLELVEFNFLVPVDEVLDGHESAADLNAHLISVVDFDNDLLRPVLVDALRLVDEQVLHPLVDGLRIDKFRQCLVHCVALLGLVMVRHLNHFFEHLLITLLCPKELFAPSDDLLFLLAHFALQLANGVLERCVVALEQAVVALHLGLLADV